ncbi:multiple monosaccharide ABC transporter substrate-binding protein [Devosia sp. RR2S18]|jgi:putative multiple sugar transport system substrate-binding protein|uniref:multiple monosaccharide ABC transporter substrate-binding protein n=1 Tax=Devosia rhizosphaerae TaxID=3049774 RepID=UPI002541B637|nr:multiple monosaccharide ABC transporter substrate-binding protein [Devosia sp. RR2S18]WIJ26202.1 sugar ABC transporter substrate-binding protein [Devosia sp. RR2S18]HEV7291219.1 multiple monosaccharide ABC transporter substrate-binding protein [Devosia sp.]
MTVMKSLAAITAVSAVALMSSGVAFAQDKGLIGVAMPEQTTLRWNSDGAELKAALEEMGYTVDLQYAGDDIPNQLAQIENMVTKGADALIIAALDGTTLSAVLEQAGAAGTEVVAYDRLIRDTENVDYYTTFDNYQVGVLQANSLVRGLEERFPDQKPWNVELFGGSPDDNNAFFFYDGAMSVLQPLIDSGDVVVKSGQQGMEQVGTLRWDGAAAQSRMDNLLSANYSDGTVVHGVLAPNDNLARGVISSLRGIGYGSGDLQWPVITGQDAEVPSIKAIIDGEQYSTVYKDTRELARVTAGLVDTVLSGETPEGLDTTTYDNGVKVVPSILLTPYEVNAENYQELVVDSGYISESDLQ